MRPFNDTFRRSLETQYSLHKYKRLSSLQWLLSVETENDSILYSGAQSSVIYIDAQSLSLGNKFTTRMVLDTSTYQNYYHLTAHAQSQTG